MDLGSFKIGVVLPIGSGANTALDTLDSIEHYCKEPHHIIIIEDYTTDGTREAIEAARRPHWHIIRNNRKHGRNRLVHSLCTAYKYVITETDIRLVLRIDQDALVIAPGVLSEASQFSETHPGVGIFGVYDRDHNRPRSFEYHRKLIDRETSKLRSLLGLRPSWVPLLKKAEANGYRRGDNIFGGAYFLTRECLLAMDKIGALDVPFKWNSILMEDVYFSMAAVAAGMQMAHFAAPEGPLCLEWAGLPMPASEFQNFHFAIIHSVDKGKNTTREENGGATAREFFFAKRAREKQLGAIK